MVWSQNSYTEKMPPRRGERNSRESETRPPAQVENVNDLSVRRPTSSKSRIDIVQYVVPRDVGEYNELNVYVEAVRARNKRWVSAAKDLGELSIPLLRHNEIKAQVAVHHPHKLKDTDTEQEYFGDMYKEIETYLAEERFDAPYTETEILEANWYPSEDESLMVDTPAGHFTYRVPSVFSVRGGRIVGHDLRVNPRVQSIRKRIVRHANDKYELEINPDASGLSMVLPLWPLHSPSNIADVEMVAPNRFPDPPAIITMSGPMLSSGNTY